MVRLLRANIARIWKTKSFWVCMILSFGVSLVNCISTVLMGSDRWANDAGSLIITGTSNTQLLTCIFIAMYIGTDYSNGTIRNKLIIGSSRFDVYMSNLITVTLGGLMIEAAQILPSAVTACFGDKLGMSVGTFALRLCIIICALIAVSAIFTLIAMLITSKSANAAISITAVFMLLLASIIVINVLNQPEYTSGYELSADGGVTQTEPAPNPMYVSGAKREVLTVINDILPSGQSAQIEFGQLHNEKLLPVYSLGVIAVTTVAGAVAFRKKDLK